MFEKMLEKVVSAAGFLAALDQSGGSTPKALALYGVPDNSYAIGKPSMYDAVHEMRTRIITNDKFDGHRILGAILFEETMDREIEDKPTAEYLWREKHIVPFLKVDRGLLPEENGVQMMTPMADLDELLIRGKAAGVFGTKMRSFIKTANADGIKAIVDQQFEIGKHIIHAGLVPILEPEVDIHSPQKAECEELLKVNILTQLDLLGEDEKVILKVTLPCVANFYKECIDHPNCIRVVALSGGYSRAEGVERLAVQHNMIASFSRSLTEGLSYSMTDEEFDKALDESIASIFEASQT
jgi:fructose-bisphosphate aldolase class I